MNIEDFTKKIEITYEDLHSIFLRGYKTAMSEIVANNLNKLDEHKRPIHCSDTKRTIIHTKTNNKWEKDEGHIITKELINSFGKKTHKQVSNWQKDNDKLLSYENPELENFFTLVKNVNEQYNENITNNILKRVAKQIPISKK